MTDRADTPDAEANARFVAGTRAAPDLAAENARLRAAIEPSEENVEWVARVLWKQNHVEWFGSMPDEGVENRSAEWNSEARAILIAINERVEPKP